jgi:hypothetical protein
VSEVTLQHTVRLDARQCAKCHRWYASEVYRQWQCGECRQERVAELEAELDTERRRVNALRGAIKRRLRRATREKNGEKP